MPSYANPYTRNNIPSVTVAPMTLGTSRYQPLMYTPSFSDANIITEGYNKKMELYGKAGQAMTAANAAIGKLYDSVDPSEYAYIDKLRAEYVDPIQNMINDGSYSRAVYYAGMSATELMFDKGLRGRINAKAKYDEFMTNLDTMRKQGEINDMTYNRMKEQNKYDYVDIYEDEDEQTARQNDALQKAGQAVERKGKIVRGTEWTPQVTPVKHYSASSIVEKALANFIKEKRWNGQSFTFYDKDGNPTPNIEDSVDGQPWIIKNGSRQKVSQEMIMEAVNALCAANPEYNESLKQDWQDKLWDAQKHPENYELGSEVYNGYGIERSFESYKNRIFGDLSKNAAYDYSSTSTTYNDNRAKYIAAMNAAGGVAAQTPAYEDLLSTTSPNNKFEDDGVDIPARTKKDMDSAKAGMDEILNKYNLSGDNITDDVIKNTLDAEDLYDYMYYRDLYQDSKDWMDTFTAGLDKNDKDAVEFDAYATSNAPSYEGIEDNKYVKNLNKILSFHDIKDDSTLIFYFDKNNNNTYNEMFNQLYGKANIQTGVCSENGDHAGQNFIKINMNNANDIMLAAQAFCKHNKRTEHMYYFRPNVTAEIDGKDIKSMIPTGDLGPASPIVYSNDGILGEILQVYNHANQTAKRVTTKSSIGGAVVANNNFKGQFISNGSLDLLYQQGFIEDSRYKTLEKQQLDDFEAKLRGHNFTDSDIWVSDYNNSNLRRATPEERAEIRSELLSSNFSKLVSSTAVNPFSIHKLGINITLPGSSVIGSDGKKIGYKQPRTIYLDGFDVESREGDKFKRDTWFRAYTDYLQRSAYNKPKTLSVGDEHVKLNLLNLGDGGSAFYEQNGEIKSITSSEAIHILDCYNIYTDFKYAALKEDLSNMKDERVKKSLRDLTEFIAKSVYGKTDSDTLYNIAYQISQEVGFTF